MISVKGKWALITGASRGIGYLTALFMGKQGCNLVLPSRSLEHTKKLIDEVKTFGEDAYCIEAELANNKEVAECLMSSKRRTQALILFSTTPQSD